MVQILRVHAGRADHRSLDFMPKAVQNVLQSIASAPDGPAAPCVHNAEFQMIFASMLSKRIG